MDTHMGHECDSDTRQRQFLKKVGQRTRQYGTRIYREHVEMIRASTYIYTYINMFVHPKVGTSNNTITSNENII